MATEKMYSARDAAKRLGVTPVRVRQFCQQGRLGKKVGNSYVITDEELSSFAKVERRRGAPKRKI